MTVNHWSQHNSFLSADSWSERPYYDVKILSSAKHSIYIPTIWVFCDVKILAREKQISYDVLYCHVSKSAEVKHNLKNELRFIFTQDELIFQYIESTV